MPRFPVFLAALFCLGLAAASLPAQADAYTVQAGDTPQSIAKKHNISVDELLKANKNLKPNKMLIGDSLTIPGSAAPAKADKKAPEKEPAHKDKAKAEPASPKERAAEARDREKEKKTAGAPAAAPAGHGGSYTVKKGDSLGSIAAKHGVSVDELLKANKNLKPTKMLIGDVLTLPGGAPAKAETAKPEPAEKPSAKASKTAESHEAAIIHTVRKNETPDAVARQYHITIKELVRLNPDIGKKLHAGQKLTIPGGAAATAAEAELSSRGAPAAEPEAAPERTPAKTARAPEPADPAPSLPESRDSADAEAAFEKGIEFGKQNKFQKAIEFFDKAIKLNANRADFFASRGHAHYYLAQYPKAIDDYTKAIEKNPSFALAYSMRGLSRARSDKYQQAVEDFNKAISLGPTEADYYKGRGFTYLRLKQYGPMCQDYQKACSLGDCELLESVKKEKLCQ
jgi:LysM repeat protein/Flp pilus assembly protein TadD